MNPAVTVTARREVPASQAGEFSREMRAFFAYAAAQPGCTGLQLLEEPRGDAVEFLVIAGFTSQAARERFVAAPAYREWMRRLDRCVTHPAEIREHAGIRLLLATGPLGPPAWRSAVVTWIGVNAVTTPLLPVAPRLFGWAPFPWSNFLMNLVVVGVLTWPVMPLLTRLFQRWLYPRQHD